MARVRDGLKRAFAGALCLSLVMLAGCTHAVIAKAPIPPGCQVKSSSGTATYTCSRKLVINGVAVGARLVIVAPSSPPGSLRSAQATTTARLTTNGQLILQCVHSAAAPLPRQANPIQTDKCEYGAAVRGLRSVELSNASGLISGTINGRSIVPFQAVTGATLPKIAFTDGQPPPVVTIDPALQAVLKTFVNSWMAHEPPSGQALLEKGTKAPAAPARPVNVPPSCGSSQHICGYTCCPAGQTCLDAKRSICGEPANP